MATVIVGITGASGIVLGYKTIDLLTKYKHHVHLVVTRDGATTAAFEMGSEHATPRKMVYTLTVEQRALITLHKNTDFFAPIASGSYQVDAMVVIPCSMTTLAACAHGISDTLLRRAVDVTLKERRKLVMVPRESPLSEIHLENMLRLTRCGAVIVPPEPAWYLHPKTIDEVETHIVSRVFDALGLHENFSPRWGA